MTRNITLKELRPKLPSVIKAIDDKMDRFIITKRGKPTALMMSIEDYESLLETLDVLSDKPLMKRIKESEKDIKKGYVRTLEAIEKEIGLV
ncbi:MAG: type II toxin-antitoxin system Phd/YefM family antitoxin [Candidatus Omnitrophota bacterium]